jgi:DNA replication licensing factor MCM6
LIEKIIDRLIYHDQIIIPLTTNAAKAGGEEEDHMLVVHPNYIVD